MSSQESGAEVPYVRAEAEPEGVLELGVLEIFRDTLSDAFLKRATYGSMVCLS